MYHYLGENFPKYLFLKDAIFEGHAIVHPVEMHNPFGHFPAVGLWAPPGAEGAQPHPWGA